jgi:chromosome partitioning protein
VWHRDDQTQRRRNILPPLDRPRAPTPIDVGGRDSAALRAALLLSDILIVPVQPRSLDVWAFSDIAALVDGAQEARAERGRPPLRACAVLSMADTGASSDNTAAVEALAEHGQFTWIDAPIRRRKAFANATGLGLAVTEMTPRDAKACEEIAELVRNVFTIAGKLHTNAKGTV